MMCALLYEAAQVMMITVQKWSWLKVKRRRYGEPLSFAILNQAKSEWEARPELRSQGYCPSVSVCSNSHSVHPPLHIAIPLPASDIRFRLFR